MIKNILNKHEVYSPELEKELQEYVYSWHRGVSDLENSIDPQRPAPTKVIYNKDHEPVSYEWHCSDCGKWHDQGSFDCPDSTA